MDFEELVRDLLGAELGVRFESFGPGRDLGIDFRFSSSLGDIVVQAKHFADSGSKALVRAARLENPKVAALKPARYLFATSVSLTPSSKQELRDALPAAPLALPDLFGKEDLNHLLGRHPDVERKHFKLWLSSATVLDRILHSGVYNRTLAEMEVIRRAIPKFVYNASVPAAQAILDKHRMLIIAGEPGVGKSTLARMIVWLHAEQDWEISVVDDIKEAFEVANEGKKRLVFFDDFLGQVRLSTDFIRSTDQRFSAFLQRVRLGKDLRFLLTTRDYILRQAQAQSEKLAASSVSVSEFTLNVGFYTRTAKAQMLFNHIYFSDLTKDQRLELLEGDFFLKIIDHRNFNPRFIQLLTSGDYISLTALPIREAVERALSNPQELWEKPYRAHISPEGRALMLSLFFNAERVPLGDLERAFGRMTLVLGLQLSPVELPVHFRAAVRELEGSVLAIQDRHVRFGNAGLRDFLQRAVMEDRLLDAAIGAVTEYAEVSQTWSVFLAQVSNPPSPQAAQAWAMAARRLRNARSGSALQRLTLFIQVFDLFKTDELRQVVQDATDDLASSEIEGWEADQCSSVLESLVLTLLPLSVVDRTKTVVSDAIRSMLRDYGGELSLEEVKSVSESLSRWGDGSSETSRAVVVAVEGQLKGLFSALYDISSVNELDAFEEELLALLNDYGVSSIYAEEKIGGRRADLIDRAGSSDRPASNWTVGRTAGWASDEQIRSMFESLRED